MNNTHRNNEIHEAVVEILIDEFGCSPASCNTQATLSDDLAFDSLDRVRLRLEIEKRFDVLADEDRIDNLLTVGEVEDYVKELTN